MSFPKQMAMYDQEALQGSSMVLSPCHDQSNPTETFNSVQVQFVELITRIPYWLNPPLRWRHSSLPTELERLSLHPLAGFRLCHDGSQWLFFSENDDFVTTTQCVFTHQWTRDTSEAQAAQQVYSQVRLRIAELCCDRRQWLFLVENDSFVTIDTNCVSHFWHSYDEHMYVSLTHVSLKIMCLANAPRVHVQP